MKTMAFKIFDDGLIVCVHTAADADEAGWNAYIEAIRTSRIRVFRTLVFTDGGRATRTQFARLEDAYSNRRLRTAVVSCSGTTRIFGTMVNALSKNMNAVFFPPESVHDALAALDMTSADAVDRALDCAAELAETVTADGQLESLRRRTKAF